MNADQEPSSALCETSRFASVILSAAPHASYLPLYGWARSRKIPARLLFAMPLQGVLSMPFCIPTPGGRFLGHPVGQGWPLMRDPSPQGEIIEPTASAVGWHGDFTSPALRGGIMTLTSISCGLTRSGHMSPLQGLISYFRFPTADAVGSIISPPAGLPFLSHTIVEAYAFSWAALGKTIPLSQAMARSFERFQRMLQTLSDSAFRRRHDSNPRGALPRHASGCWRRSRGWSHLVGIAPQCPLPAPGTD